MATTLKHLPAAGLLALLLTACGDKAPTDPVDASVGSLRVKYSGVQSGAIDAIGKVPATTSTSPMQSFAAAVTFNVPIFGVPGPGRIKSRVIAYDVKPTGVKEVVLEFAGVLTGDYTFDYDESYFGELPFVSGSMTMNTARDKLDGDVQLWGIISGRMTISEYSTERIRGTFSGTARLIHPTTYAYVPGQELTFSNGTFDVPLVEQMIP
jgi:hypothetical protein